MSGPRPRPHLINGTGDKAAHIPAVAKHVGEAGGEGRGRLHSWEGNLPNVVLQAKTKDPAHLVHGHTPGRRAGRQAGAQAGRMCDCQIWRGSGLVLRWDLAWIWEGANVPLSR